MIISHKHKFIFIKTTKTAGTSIEIALSKYCGPDDIIGPMTPEDNEIRKELGYPCTQNIGADGPFWEHMSAREIINVIGEQWSDYFTFCFERHPFERAVSLYWHWTVDIPEDEKPTLPEFIEHGSPYILTQRGFDLYTISGKVVVDKVYFYEYLEESLGDIAQRLGLDERIVLPRAKSRFRQDHRPASDVLSDTDKKYLSMMFARELAYWRFTPDGTSERRKKPDGTKLNLGSGKTRLDDFLNVDKNPSCQPDIVHDLENIPYPFDDDSIEHVILSHVYEHIRDAVGMMKEIYRICKDKAMVEIRCPYWTYAGAVADPTHVRQVNELSFQYYDATLFRMDGTTIDHDFEVVDKQAFVGMDVFTIREIYFKLIVHKPPRGAP